MAIAVNTKMVYSVVKVDRNGKDIYYVVAKERIESLNDLLGGYEYVSDIQGTTSRSHRLFNNNNF